MSGWQSSMSTRFAACGRAPCGVDEDEACAVGGELCEVLCGVGIDDVGLWQCEQRQVVCCELAELWLLLYVGGLCKVWRHE